METKSEFMSHNLISVHSSASSVAVMEGLQHSLMSDFCEKLERRLQLMEKRLAGATIDDLIQHFRTIAENVSEVRYQTLRARLCSI